MPLYRYIDAPQGLDDATYLHDTNPDPERFEAVEELATGGVITDPILTIVGETGPELVTPLDIEAPATPEPAESGETDQEII